MFLQQKVPQTIYAGEKKKKKNFLDIDVPPEWRCSAKEKEFGNLTIISEGKG
jgi:hypothetical protein